MKLRKYISIMLLRHAYVLLTVDTDWRHIYWRRESKQILIKLIIPGASVGLSNAVQKLLYLTYSLKNYMRLLCPLLSSYIFTCKSHKYKMKIMKKTAVHLCK